MVNKGCLSKFHQGTLLPLLPESLGGDEKLFHSLPLGPVMIRQQDSMAVLQ